MEKSSKKDKNGRIKHIIVRNNKDTKNILKFEKQKATSDPLEQSDIKNIQNGEERMENQIIGRYKTEESVHKQALSGDF